MIMQSQKHLHDTQIYGFTYEMSSQRANTPTTDAS